MFQHNYCNILGLYEYLTLSRGRYLSGPKGSVKTAITMIFPLHELLNKSMFSGKLLSAHVSIPSLQPVLHLGSYNVDWRNLSMRNEV